MLIGRSPAMIQLIKIVRKVALTDADILITGENGTGKEMLAREIHQLSPRHSETMLSVDMGATVNPFLRVNFLGTNEEPLPTPAKVARVNLKQPTEVRSLWMK